MILTAQKIFFFLTHLHSHCPVVAKRSNLSKDGAQYWENNYCKTSGGWERYWWENESLKWRKTLLNYVKRYEDNHLTLAKVDIIDPRKEDFVQPLSIPEILAELQIADVGYCRAFSISKDDYFELHPSEKEAKFLFCK